jgi:antitoxin (DNA-binding transcriptional repressor) of toxin-antitoxin stability system
LLDKVEAGEEVIITRRGRAVAHIHALSPPKHPLRLDDLAAICATMPRLRRPSAELLREALDEFGGYDRPRATEFVELCQNISGALYMQGITCWAAGSIFTRNDFT